MIPSAVLVGDVARGAKFSLSGEFQVDDGSEDGGEVNCEDGSSKTAGDQVKGETVGRAGGNL